MTTSEALDLKTLTDTNYPSKPQVTESEYWEQYYQHSDISYEWDNGYLEEKPVSDVLTLLMYKWFFELLEHYLKTHPIAQSVLLDMGFRLHLPAKTVIRQPDLGVVLNTNPVPLLPEDKSYQGIFDLCVEAISDSKDTDILRDTEQKKTEYAQAGVKEYYILDGHNRYIAFYQLNANGVYIPIKPLRDKIIQSTVLPGFQFWIEDLFTKPSLDDMIEDPIYQGFVLPKYQQEKRARWQAEQQIETEKLARWQAEQQIETEKQARWQAEQQAQQAEQQAQQFAELLRSLGADPDQILKERT
jgi:phage regulator Rha-like protein